MAKIYTRSGDGGDTGLGNGVRVRKDAARVAAYGTVDELNATLGVARAEGLPAEDDPVVARIQCQLFVLGTQLAAPEPNIVPDHAVGAADVEWLEQMIDGRQLQLEPLAEFILPGGTRAAAALHLARCVCRRAERLVVRLGAESSQPPDPVRYLNRLGDLLFVLARAANRAAGVRDVRWRNGRC